MKSNAEILVCFVHPDNAIKPSLISKAIAILFLNFSQALLSSPIFSTAAVPITTLSTPTSNQLLILSIFLIPPPI